MQVGPSLGMRKSSSLESLQTAMLENKRRPNEPTYARVHPRKLFTMRLKNSVHSSHVKIDTF